MDVLVTGGSGFIGRYLVPLLRERHDVTAVVHPEAVTPSWLAGVSCKHADLARPGAVDALRVAEHDAVVHMAAMSNPAACEAHPAAARALNVTATAELADACPGRMVFLSSVHVYGPATTLPRPVVESTPRHPSGAYAASKHDAEKMVMASGAPGNRAVLRLANVYGPHQSPDYVVGRLISAARHGRALEVRDPRPIRDFVFVADVAECIEKALDKGSGAINVGSGLSASIGEVRNEVARLVGQPTTPTAGTEPMDALHLVVQRAHDALGWRATTSLEQGLQACLDQP